MRRLVIALLLVALTTDGVAALASGSDSQAPRKDQHAKQHHGKRGHHGGIRHALRRMVVRSLADRLGVEPRVLGRALRETMRTQKKAYAAAAGVTAAERRALRACHRRGARRACDRAAARSALDKLRSHEPDLAAIKDSGSRELATRLGLTQETFLEAARAELAARLDQAMKLGFVTETGRTLTLACFDTPADCDLGALHGEFRHRRHFR